jgi:hypothetical protein
MEWKRVNGLRSIQARWQTGRHVRRPRDNSCFNKPTWSANFDHSSSDHMRSTQAVFCSASSSCALGLITAEWGNRGRVLWQRYAALLLPQPAL